MRFLLNENLVEKVASVDQVEDLCLAALEEDCVTAAQLLALVTDHRRWLLFAIINVDSILVPILGFLS
jgi:hypothetical protein